MLRRRCFHTDKAVFIRHGHFHEHRYWVRFTDFMQMRFKSTMYLHSDVLPITSYRNPYIEVLACQPAPYANA